ncbi:putative protein OS=Afipia felis OX=1035 GN=BN961_01650 PE=4 SV=1 [Afipia felis]
MTAIGAYSPSLLNSASQGYAAATGQPSLAQTLDERNSGSPSSTSTNVTLSDAAKTYLAGLQDASAAADVTPSALAANARAWFDAQYQSLGISSAMLDGKAAVDFSSQSRATLSAVASNTDGLFSADETKAAAGEMQARFNTAMAPRAVIARHNADYASLYQAASDYLDQAGDAEKASSTWKAQKQAVAAGLAAAMANPGKAPATGDVNDPVAALLAAPVSGVSAPGADATTAEVAANARAMLDDQQNKAKDKGLELVFNSGRSGGQMVDFKNFDNRTLATIVLNPNSSFSGDETYAAKKELDQRTRTSMYNALFPSNNSSNNASSSNSPGLLQTYNNMSAEEKTVLGVTDAVTSRVLASYKTQQSVQNTLASYL